MSLEQLLNTPITITRRLPSADVDSYGDEVSDEETEATVGELQQRSRTENPAQGEVSSTDWLLVLPAGTDLRTGDMVTVDGIDYEAVGDSWSARNPLTGHPSHVEATVRRVEGSEEAS